MLLRQNMSQMMIADMPKVSQSQDQQGSGWRALRCQGPVVVFTSGGLEEAIAQGQLLLVVDWDTPNMSATTIRDIFSPQEST